MRYDDNPYEDELDRLRARRQRKKNGQQSAPGRRKPAFRVYDNADTMEYGVDDDDLDFEEFDLDDDGADGRDYYDDYEDPGDDDDYDYYDGYDEEDEISAPSFQEKRRAIRGSRNMAASPVRKENPLQQKKVPAGTAKNRQNASAQGGKKRKKKKGFFKVLLLAAVIFAGYLLFQWVRDDSYWTIAVYGVDSRDGNVGKGALSDVEMLCSINKKTGEIRLVSVFRDSYLRIDQNDDYDKINEAYFKGGHKQATDALRDNLDLQIDDYATFNWKAVVDAINVLGGVDIEITDKEFAFINSFITETVNSTGVGSVQLEHGGMNHLDGVQAVAYARLRLMDTDFNRTERQRKVLGQAMEKAKNADFNTLKTLVGAVYPQISTSVGVDDLISMAKNAKKYYIGQTSGFPFSHQEMKIGKKSCVIPTTLESNVVQLHSFLYDNAQYVPSADVKKISTHIAEVSGLGDPGKDTESGKNIGTEGNSGGGQGSGQPDQTQAPAPPSETPPPETESETAESETEPESSTETESTEPTVEPLESEEETQQTSGIIEQPTAEEGGPQQTGPGAHNGGSGGNNGSANSSDGSSSQSSQPSSSQNGGTSETPGTTEIPEHTTGSLEGPGQGGSSTAEEQGPGV